MINAQQGGLGALQPAPQQQLGSMAGAPAARLAAPKSPQQAAAEQIVESDVPKELEALLKERKAMELLASAQRDKQAQQPVQPQTIKSQVEGGISSLMQSLMPGMAQRGRQVQVAQNRRMMGMAGGGIVGMAEGGPTLGAVSPKAADPQDVKRLADLYRQMQASMDAATDPTAKANVQQRLNDLKTQMGDQLPFVMQYLDSTKGTIEPRTEMAEGGIVGYNSRGYVDSLAAALEAEGITDPVAVELIRSIYGQESSSGRNTGPSPAGARGPMQVMPATFVEMMGPDADIDDPMTNLRAGSRYAQQMLRRAGGDPRLAAAGYYGGPGGMDKLRAGRDTQAPQEDFPSVSEYADEVTARMRTTPEGVERLLNLNELSEERQQVEVEAPRERPMTPEERRTSLAANPDRIDNVIGNYIENYVKENPIETAATLAMLPLGGGLAMGAGRMGLGALSRFAPRAGSTLSKFFTKPNPNVIRGSGFTMRPPGQGLRAFSPTRTGATLGATTLGVKGLYDRMTDGEDEEVAPAPREPTPQEMLGSAVFQTTEGRPTAMFKAGEARRPEERGLMSRIGSALTSDRAGAIANALSKLSYAGGATEGYMGQKLQAGLQAEKAAADKVRLQEEAIEADLARSEATLEAARQTQLAKQRADLVDALGKYEGTAAYMQALNARVEAGEDPAAARTAIMQEKIAEIMPLLTGQGGLTQMTGLTELPEGVTVTRKG
jgi:hypothetical protein